MSTSGIVLAAGYSSRMRGFKPLVEIDGGSLLARAVRAVKDAGVDDVVVVAGHRAADVTAAADGLGVRTVVNDAYADGMFSSVRTGVAALCDTTARFLLLPVDCGLVRPETVGRLLRVAGRSAACVYYPLVGAKRGHPPLVGAELRDEIVGSTPGGGLRELLAAYDSQALDVPVRDEGAIMDIDTDERLEEARIYATAERLPDAELCLSLLRRHDAPSSVIAHSQTVSRVATRLTTALNACDQHLCPPLVVAASLLHDIARTQPRHATAGARLLTEQGYRRVAAVVERHVDLEDDSLCDVGEAAVVNLADKLVIDDRVVDLQTKLRHRRLAFADKPESLPFMEARMAVAADIQSRIEQLIGPLPLGADDGGLVTSE